MSKIRITDKATGRTYNVNWEEGTPPNRDQVKALLDAERSRDTSLSNEMPVDIPEAPPKSPNYLPSEGLMNVLSYGGDILKGAADTVGIPTSMEEAGEMFSPMRILRDAALPPGVGPMIDHGMQFKERIPELMNLLRTSPVEGVARTITAGVPGLAPLETAGENIGEGLAGDQHKLIRGATTGILSALAGRQMYKDSVSKPVPKPIDPVDLVVDDIMNAPDVLETPQKLTPVPTPAEIDAVFAKPIEKPTVRVDKPIPPEDAVLLKNILGEEPIVDLDAPLPEIPAPIKIDLPTPKAEGPLSLDEGARISQTEGPSLDLKSEINKLKRENEILRLEKDLEAREKLGILETAVDTPKVRARLDALKRGDDIDFGGDIPPSKNVRGSDLPDGEGSIELNSPGRIKRATQPVGKVLEEIGPEISEPIKAYEKEYESRASSAAGRYKEIVDNIPDNIWENEIVPYLDKGKEIANPNTKSIADTIRSLTEEVKAEAEIQGIGTDKWGIDNYFPHKFKDGTWEHDVKVKKGFGRDNPDSHLEKQRSGANEYRTDKGVLTEYFSDAYRRLSERKHLGASLEKVLKSDFVVKDPEVRDYIIKAVERLTGREKATPVSKVAGKLRHVTALSDLALSAPLQVGQAAHIASRGGLGRALEAAKVVMKDRQGTTLQAVKDGALWPSISHETARTYGSPGFMWGTPTVDAAMRVHANTVGRLILRDALKGDKGAIKELNRLGFKNIREGMEGEVGKKFADNTNFRTGVLDLPLWSTSPMGKLVTQYTTFMYQHTHFVKNLFKDALKGDIMPLVKFSAILAPIIGEVINDTRSTIKYLGSGIIGNEELSVKDYLKSQGVWGESEKDWKKIFSNKRVSIKNPAMRVLQNIFTVGGVGIFQVSLEKFLSGEFPENLAGPAISNVGKGLRAGKESVTKGDTKPIGKFATEQIPLVGYDVSKKMFPKKKKKKRLLDAFDLSVNLE